MVEGSLEQLMLDEKKKGQRGKKKRKLERKGNREKGKKRKEEKINKEKIKRYK